MKKRIILYIINLLLSILFFIQILRLDILPLKYLIVIVISVLILLLFSLLLIYSKKKGIRIFGYILLSLCIIGNILGVYHIKKIDSYINKSFNVVKTEKIKYYVVALSNNNLKKKNITGDLGYYEKSVNVNKAIDHLDNKYKIDNVNFENLNNLFDKLDNNEIKFITIEKSNFNIVMELDKNRKEENYNVIDEFYVTKKLKGNSKQRDKEFNIYVGGTDYVGLMDFNTIITVNTKTHKILLTSIPRDYYVDVAGYNYKNKLSFITEGIDVSKETIANVFDIDIDYYVKIDADSVVKLIDEIGGIDYCSDYAYSGSYFYYQNGVQKSGTYYIKKGCQHLNGYNTIAASRTRNAFNGRDRVRQQNMQKIMVAIFKKMVSPEMIGNTHDVLVALDNSYETDIPDKIIRSVIKDTINNGNRWTVETQSVDGTDGQDVVHRFDNIVDWVVYPNVDTVKDATAKINKTLEVKQ